MLRPDSYTASGIASRNARAPARVEVDRRHRHPAGAEVHRPGAGAAELDAGVLELDQVVERLGQRAEAVLEFLAQQDQVGDLARARDPPVQFDLRGLVRHVVTGHVRVHGQVHPHGLGGLLGRVRAQQAHRLVEHAM